MRPVTIEGFSHYLISYWDGILFNTRTENVVKGWLNKNDYRRLWLSDGKRKAKFYMQIIVAGAWIPNPNNLPEVNHIDWNRDHNSVPNLNRMTKRQNLEYRYNVYSKMYDEHNLEPTEEESYISAFSSDDLPF